MDFNLWLLTLLVLYASAWCLRATYPSITRGALSGKGRRRVSGNVTGR